MPGTGAKNALWTRLMKNFVLPEPEVASDEEVERSEERRVGKECRL